MRNSNRGASLLPGVVLVILGAVVYANALTPPFIFDDAFILTFNPDSLELRASSITPRVIVGLTFLANYLIDGYQVAGYHLVNILIHLLAGVTYFAILARIFARQGEQTAGTQCLAWITALLWVLHPLQTESVTYISQRYESLMGLFGLLTLYGYVRWSLASACGGKGWAVLAIVACALGMLTKQVMVVVPVVVCLFDYVFLSARVGARQRRWPLLLGLFLTWTVLIAASLWERRVQIHEGNAMTVMAVGVGSWQYLLTQSEVILHYLKLVVWPVGLCLDYPWAPVAGFPDVVASFLLLAGVVVAAAVGLMKKAWWGFLTTSFFLILAPSSSVLPLADMAAEHRLYLPLACVLPLITVTLGRALSRIVPEGQARARTWQLLLLLILLGWAACLALLTQRRNELYRSPEAMWRDLLRHYPDNLRQRLALATLLLGQGRYEEAAEENRELLNRLEQLAPTPHPAPAADPGEVYPEARNQAGRIKLAMGDHDGAITEFRAALSLTDLPHLHQNLAMAFLLAGNMQEAYTEIEQAVRDRPLNANNHVILAKVLMGLGRHAEAIPAFEEALRLDPVRPVERCELARLLIECPDTAARSADRALLHVERASVDTAHQSVRVCETYARVRAYRGEYADAARLVDQALAIAQGRGESGEELAALREEYRRLASATP